MPKIEMSKSELPEAESKAESPGERLGVGSSGQSSAAGHLPGGTVAPEHFNSDRMDGIDSDGRAVPPAPEAGGRPGLGQEWRSSLVDSTMKHLGSGRGAFRVQFSLMLLPRRRQPSVRRNEKLMIKPLNAKS